MNQEPIHSEPQPMERPSPSPAKKIVGGIFEILEMFAWSVFVVLIVFSFVVRLCRVEGGSMENTLYNGQYLLLYSLNYTPKQNDIIVFHLTDEENNQEKTMVKRVIATGGQTVEIDFNTCVILVDGVAYEDTHAVLKTNAPPHLLTGEYELFANHHYQYEEDGKIRKFSATVPQGTLFVMGDNRNNSMDSRNSVIGFVDERCVLGKAILRLNPLTSLS